VYVAFFELFSIYQINYHSSSFSFRVVSRSVVTSPEAVLHDEDEEKQEATNHSGDTEA